jgi:hypothetical protein
MQSHQKHIDPDGFRLRGASSTRLDNFSDVVFGFALTLIVLSQAVPRTYDQLRAVLLGVGPFAACFLLFIAIWLAHYRFFRRYGMTDRKTIWINMALLLTVLLYVYPMKFLFTFAAGHTPPGTFSNPNQIRQLMMVYGAGFSAIYLCFAALYANAWHQRQRLELNPLETTLTLTNFWNYIGNVSVGLICCLLAYLLPVQRSGEAGYGFLLLLIWGRSQAIVSRRFIRSARARTTPQDLLPIPHQI